jgi:hypothetical protein
MAVDQERGSGGQSRMHGQGFASIELDQDEALPAGTVSMAFWLHAVEERLLELENLFHMHADNKRLAGSNRGVGEDDIFELVGAGRKDRSTFVDLGGIEEIEDREVLNLKDLVHTLEAEPAFSVEEVGDVSLLESSLLSEAEPGEFACFDAVQKNFAEVFLQDFELHGRSIAPGYDAGIRQNIRELTVIRWGYKREFAPRMPRAFGQRRVKRRRSGGKRQSPRGETTECGVS